MADDLSSVVERRITETVEALSRLRSQDLVYRQALAIEVIRTLLARTPERTAAAVELVSLVELLERGEVDPVTMPEFVAAHRHHVALSGR